ncbi:MAG TPA: PEP-CTERM sorting domain-containing protein [Thermoguttaceae bacterium]|nr:PEP-CTERM sorting domain-containing protein [Thermoguttaceae bacterium]
MRRSRTILAAAVFVFGGFGHDCETIAAEVVNWTGSGTGFGWDTGANWSNGSGPGLTDTVYFGNAGASQSIPGQLTSLLTGDRSIGGLTYNNSNYYHATDLGGFTLTVLGDSNFNVNQPGATSTFIRNGTLNVAGPSVNVGRSYSGGAWAIVDLGGLSQFNADVAQFHVGTRISGSAFGQLTLAEINHITATEIVVADNGTGNVTLGQTNTIVAPDVLIGGSYGNAVVDIRNGGTLQLGTESNRTSLTVGKGIINTNSTYIATLDLSGATLDAFLDHLTVGEKADMPGNQKAVFIGGDSGSVSIGEPANRSNMVVGYRASGQVEFGAMDSFTACLDEMILGLGGSATVSLPELTSIDARRIAVGSNGSSTLSLGLHNTILVDEFDVGGSYSNALVEIRPGGTLDLGAPDRRTTLTVGKGIINTNSTYAGTLDLSGVTLNAYLDHLTVGQKANNPGNQRGYFYGGDGGSISIGEVGNTSNVIVADLATAEVDFGAMDHLSANLDEMILGRGGSATVTLPATNVIDARRIAVGESSSTTTLSLGLDNTILVDELDVGNTYCRGLLKISSGGTLRLGAPDRRTNLTIGKGITNTNSSYYGTVDMTNATLVAYLDHVIVGEKDTDPGNQRGTLTISDHADNYVDANTIVIGGTKSTGTLDFAGGTMRAGSIEKGPGTAYFNWTGGTLHVDAFGSPERDFKLTNTGDGILAPGNTVSVGTTQVYGEYQQGAFASTQIQLAGTIPGSGYDQLRVSGKATLAGTLDLHLLDAYVSDEIHEWLENHGLLDFLDPYVPDPGDAFDVLTYGSRSGQFDFVDPPALPADRAFELDYDTDPNKLTVRIVAPMGAALMAAAPTTTWSDSANWQGGSTPRTNAATTLTNAAGTPCTVLVDRSSTVHSLDVSGNGEPMSLVVPKDVKLAAANDVVLRPNSLLDLQDGALLARQVELDGGSLTGVGAILLDGPLCNGGTVSPGASSGTLRIGGDYRQSSTGTLQMEIASATEFDQLIVDGEASLGGLLSIEYLAEGLEPGVYPILRYGSLSGTFDDVQVSGLPPELFSIHYGAPTSDAVTLTVVPEPSTLILLAMAALGLPAYARRRRGRRT